MSVAVRNQIAGLLESIAGGARTMLFEYSGEPRAAALRRVVYAAFCLGGVMFWAAFLRWGRSGLSFLDWPYFREYVSVCKAALATLTIPYHMTPPLYGTDRFLAIPELIFSPQIVLVRWLSPAAFLLVDLLLLYLAGFAGSVLLARRYRLALFPFAVFFVLFNFNGAALSQVSVGHVWSYAYFLLPFFVLFVLRLIDGEDWLTNSLWIALTVSAMFLQGGFHFYNYCMMLLLFVSIFSPRYLRAFGLVCTVSVALLACRLIPAFMAVGKQQAFFVNGFSGVYDLLFAFIQARYPQGGRGSAIGEWEKNYYIGLAGAAVVFQYAVRYRFVMREKLARFRFQALDLPLLAIFVIAMGQLYRPIWALHIPLAAAERAPSRFLAVPLVVLFALTAIRMQHSGDLLSRGWYVPFLAAGLFAYGAWDLFSHSRYWGLELAEQMFGEPSPISLQIANRPDATYKSLLFVSLGISIIAHGLCLYVLYRKRAATPPGQEHLTAAVAD